MIKTIISLLISQIIIKVSYGGFLTGSACVACLTGYYGITLYSAGTLTGVISPLYTGVGSAIGAASAVDGVSKGVAVAEATQAAVTAAQTAQMVNTATSVGSAASSVLGTTGVGATVITQSGAVLTAGEAAAAATTAATTAATAATTTSILSAIGTGLALGPCNYICAAWWTPL